MTIGPDDYCCGEFPPLRATDFPGATTITTAAAYSAAAAFEALDALLAENAKLRSDLAAARQARDTAQAQLAHYNRKGW